MFSIKLYRFSKKPESTAIPTSSGTTFSCDIKTPSSVYSPIIDLKLTGNTVQDYNYAYIPEFHRYYFITDTVYNMGTWTMLLTVDLLGSFRSDIRDSTQYIARANSAAYANQYIIDTVYKTYRDGQPTNFFKSPSIAGYKRYNNSTQQWVSVDPFNTNIANGYYMVGIVGSSLTGVNYYMMNSITFSNFLRNAFNTVPSDMTDVATGTASAIYNVIQYITVCKWYPIAMLLDNTGGAVSSVTVGGLTVSLGTSPVCYFINTKAIEHFKCSVMTPDHPQLTTALKYLNYSPYRELGLYFQPFGCIPIDTTKLLTSQLGIEWYVDYCTGIITLELRAIHTDDSMLIWSGSAEYGVEIPISSLTYDTKGALMMGAANYIRTGLENGGEGFLGVQFTGKTAGLSNKEQVAVPAAWGTLGSTVADIARGMKATSESLKASGQMDLINSAVNIAGASLGQLNTTGAQGSFLAYNMEKPYIYAWFTLIAETDPARFGYPIYKSYKLSTINGYCLCVNAHVTYNQFQPLAIERQGIESMLNSGVYIE